jgi:hypothetical protein
MLQKTQFWSAAANRAVLLSKDHFRPFSCCYPDDFNGESITLKVWPLRAGQTFSANRLTRQGAPSIARPRALISASSPLLAVITSISIFPGRHRGQAEQCRD